MERQRLWVRDDRTTGADGDDVADGVIGGAETRQRQSTVVGGVQLVGAWRAPGGGGAGGGPVASRKTLDVRRAGDGKVAG